MDDLEAEEDEHLARQRGDLGSSSTRAPMPTARRRVAAATPVGASLGPDRRAQRPRQQQRHDGASPTVLRTSSRPPDCCAKP
jgi:hypothetical protein